MKLILIFGPPASGKHSIGHELQKLTQFKFFHNHLVVDAVLSLFDFGTPSFVKMREELWKILLDEAANAKLDGVIFTFNPEKSVPRNFVNDLKNQMTAKGVEMVLVKVTCPEEIIEQRIAQPSRHHFKKLTSLQLYKDLRDEGAFDESWMPTPDLILSSEKVSPETNARVIFDFLS